MKTLALIKQFIPFLKYCIVGVIGTAIDVLIVFLLVEFFSFNPLVAAVGGFLLAVSNNFFLNKIWTFRNKSSRYGRLYIKFLLVSGVGLCFTLLIMYLLWSVLGVYYLLAKVLTSGVVLIWNFLANKFWTFRIKERFPVMIEGLCFDLSIVVPAYNEQSRIKQTLITINNYVMTHAINAEIIVIDDGSNDKTKEIVNDLRPLITNLKLISYQRNKGKGFAVAGGIFASGGRYILFTDADNATSIENYSSLRTAISDKHVAIGSRYLLDSDVKKKQSVTRRSIGRIGNFFIRLFLIDGVIDTQCGFKLLEHRAAQEIFCRQKVYRFGFDAEMLVIAESLGYKIIEVPITWVDVPGSRFRPVRDSLRTFVDLLYIKMNLWSGRYV